MIARREFISLLGGATVAWPVAAWGQQPAMPVIGFLGPTSPDLFAQRLQSFRQGLGEAGFLPDRNVQIEYRWAGGNMKQMPGLALDFARLPVTVIVAAGLSAALAAKAATPNIPIVFFIGEDPVEVGLVASLNRPGGNLTGVTTLNTEVGPKRLELMREVLPSAKVMAVLINLNSPNVDGLTNSMQAAARNLGLTPLVVHASAEREFDPLFASLAERRVGAVVITTDAFYISRGEQLAHSAMRNGLPAIFQYRNFVKAGGLMSYGSSFLDAYRQVGVYAAGVLKGEKPAGLPVQQATKIELFVNLKTAKALGLTFPTSILLRADEVIE